MTQTAAQPESGVAVGALRGKSFRPRALAWIIDLVLMYLTSWVLGTLAGFSLAVLYTLFGTQATLKDSSTQILDIIGSLVLSAAYGTFFEGLYGSTPGKLVLGMRVVKEDGSGIGLGTAIVRALTRFIDGLVFGLPAYMAMKSPFYQRIGDKMARTIVVARRDPGISAPRPWWWFLVASLLYLALGFGIAFVLLLTMIG